MTPEQEYRTVTTADTQHGMTELPDSFLRERSYVSAPVDQYGMTMVAAGDPFLPGPSYANDRLDDIADIIYQEVPYCSFPPSTLNDVPVGFYSKLVIR